MDREKHVDFSSKTKRMLSSYSTTGDTFDVATLLHRTWENLGHVPIANFEEGTKNKMHQ